MKQADTESRSLILHYIERVHNSMLATGASINRAYVLQCVCCIITVFLSFGIARPNDEISVAGLTLQVPLWEIIVGMSVLVAVIFTYLVGLSNHLLRLRRLVIQSYLDVGFTKPQSTKSAAHPLEYPDITSVIADMSEGVENKFAHILSRGLNVPILITTLVLFPVAAQLSVAQYLIRSFGWKWFDIVYIIFILVSILSNCIVFIMASRPDEH